MAPEAQAELRHALEQLAAREPELRKVGASTLVELTAEPEAPPVLRPHFVQLLADPLPDLRAAACAGLRASGAGGDTLALLEKALGDSDSPVRREAARSLALLEEPASIPALQRALADPDAQVAFEAAIGLASLHDPSGAEILLAAVEDSMRRFAALGALAQLGEQRGRAAAERVLNRFFASDFDRAQAAGLLARLGVESGREFLLSRLARPKAEERGLAMELCGEHRVLAAIPALREALNNPKDPFRGTAARSLGLLGEDPSGTTLDRLASNPAEEFDVRCDAMEGLMFLGTPGALTALRRLSEIGESPQVRAAANDALDWLSKSSARTAP